MDRRRFTWAGCAAVMGLGAGRTSAQAAAPAAAGTGWAPSRPVRLVVPAAPGSVPDATARPLAERLAVALGQPVLVENRPGAGGIVGMEAVVRAAPDGHTIGLATQSQLVFNPHLFERLLYDPQRDVALILRLASVAMVLAAHPTLPAPGLRELAALARAQAQPLQIAVPPLGTPPHVLGLLLQHAAGLRLEAIPFKGSAEAVAACVAGEVKLVIEAPPVVAPQALAGRLRALAVTGQAREAQLPEVPTAGEVLGKPVPGDTWFGLVAPAGTPAEAVQRLQQEAAAALAQAELQTAYARFGWRLISGSSPTEFAATLRDDTQRWGAILKAAGVKLG